MRRNSANTVRIIGGQWRSRLVTFPDAEKLRPTPDRVRETLFNWLGQRLAGKACLDLFSGSGVLGFEALSRGADSVVMVEKGGPVVRALRENAERLGAQAARIVHADALAYLREAHEPVDLVFLDPPYGRGLERDALELLPPLLRPGARVYLESDTSFDPPVGWSMLRDGRAGMVHFHLLERVESGAESSAEVVAE